MEFAMSARRPDTTLLKLFGGAMECLLPAAYVDVSDLRQVPDHQEVFASREDGVSIVIEVLSFEEEIPSEDGTKKNADGGGDGGGGGGGGSSARHFFDDLAAANGASSSTCDFCADMTDSIMPKLASYSKAALAGRQTVAKFRGDGPPEAVRLYLVNVRLPHVGTDLLLTVNVPYPDEGAAARSMAGAECFLPTAADAAAATDGGGSSGASPACAQAAGVAAAGGVLESGKASSPAADASCGGEGAEEGAPAEEVAAARDELTDAPGCAEAGSGEGAGDGEGGRRRRRHPSSAAGRDEVGAGVVALRSLLDSFDILDWSLFG